MAVALTDTGHRAYYLEMCHVAKQGDKRARVCFYLSEKAEALPYYAIENVAVAYALSLFFSNLILASNW
jgi:hypothetical protein